MSTTPISFEDRSYASTEARSLGWREGAFWSTLALAPATLGIALGRRSPVLGGVAAGLSALALAGVRWQMRRWFTAEPAYEVEARHGRLEVRRYDARVEASTSVAARTFDDALAEGFRRLAGYIFGGNHAHQKLAMTAPVTSEAVKMVTPGVGETYTISFVMPAGRSMFSLPHPSDTNIELHRIATHTIAALAFRGKATAELVRERERELLALVQRAGLTPIGEPRFAGFDPPWTLPWLRRNEVWVEIK